MQNYKTIEKQLKEKQLKARSKWETWVIEYALEMVEMLQAEKIEATKENLLNGADDWNQASEWWCYLIYDLGIAERLATKSEIKKLTRKNGGIRKPNKNEFWLDTQARALTQASRLVLRLSRNN